MAVADLVSRKRLEAALLRVGLVAAGAYLLHLVSVLAYPPVIYRALGTVILLLLCGLLGFALIAAAGIHPASKTRWLILLAYILGTLVLAVKWMQTSYLSDLVEGDTALYMDFAARLLLEGKNPYTWDYAGVFDLFRTSPIGGTPRLDGVMAISSYPYPALSFLVLVPFQLLRLPAAFLTSILALIGVLILLFVRSPKAIQPLTLLPFFVGLDFAELVPIGTMDIVWALLLTCMVLVWREPVWRAVFYGLAIAFKQSAWLVAPFLIISLWLDEEAATPSSFRRVIKFLAISGGIFVMANGPFVLWDAAAWYRGVAVNLQEPLAMLSQGGLASLTQSGFVYLPKSFYMGLTLAVFALLLFTYARHHETLRYAFWFMPGIFLWVTYRSINAYWLYWVFPATAAAINWLITPWHTSAPRVKVHSWKPTLLLALAVLLLVLVGAVVMAPNEPRVILEPQIPLLAGDGYGNSMTVVLSNNSGEVMRPRFAVQHQDQFLNPLSWQIDDGPAALGPGESATYRISTDKNTYGFLLHENAHVVATDANGNYKLRTVARLEPDVTYLWPESIPNPDFQVWDAASNAPIHWHFLNDPPGTGQIAPIHKDDRPGLTIKLDTSYPGYKWAAVQNLIVFPQRPFGVWLYLDPALQDARDVAYGLEFNDGEHRLWVLYGTQDYAGSAPDGVRILRRWLPAGAWSLQEIDLPALYAEAGWDPPPFAPAVYRGLDADFQLVWLRLMIATPAETRQVPSAYFGPIEYEYQMDPQDRMAQILDDPADFYVRLARAQAQDRNYWRALEAYQQALRFSPGNAEALEEMQQLREHLSGRQGQ